MKNMNRIESKKIAVMAAIIMGLMMFAFMPLASATVTSFTVTPGTGLAGAVDSYDVLVTTDGVTSINITIPAGFIVVEPMSSGVEIARVDFWNSSTKAYYGYATITSSDASPTTQVDIHCDFGGATATTTQNVDYTAGKTNTFVSNVGGDTSSAIIKLPTEDDTGSINITITCTAFHLDDVMIAIKQFVRNPLTAADYVFTTDDGKTATVTITAPGGCGIIFSAPFWFVDSTGNHIADDFFGYGCAGTTPLIGDLNQDGSNDIAVVDLPTWFVDTTGNHIADDTFGYGFAGATPLVGDFNQDGKDDIAVVDLPWWFVDTNGDQIADETFSYGFAGAKPLVGDFNQDGKDDIAVVDLPTWFVDTDMSRTADLVFGYGFPGGTPLVGDFDLNGRDDIAVVFLPWWFVDINMDRVAEYSYSYGFAGGTPLVGNIV
jgi:hypothetical protein